MTRRKVDGVALCFTCGDWATVVQDDVAFCDSHDPGEAPQGRDATTAPVDDECPWWVVWRTDVGFAHADSTSALLTVAGEDAVDAVHNAVELWQDMGREVPYGTALRAWREDAGDVVTFIAPKEV